MALSAVLLLSPLRGAWAQCDAFRTGIPDFDQRRSTLGNNGLNHCVPTANTNLLAYIASNGYSAVLGGPRDWQDNANYGAVTGFINAQASRMGTNPNSGTLCNRADDGLRDYLNDVVKNSFTVTHLEASGGFAPSPADAYWAMIPASSPALVNMGIGWYWRNVPTQTWDRRGGHQVTLWGVENACTSTPLARINDPGTDSDLNSQSTFSTFDIQMTRVLDNFHVDWQIGHDHRWMMRCDNYSSGGLAGFLESVVLVEPTRAVYSPAQLGVLRTYTMPPLIAGPPHPSDVPGIPAAFARIKDAKFFQGLHRLVVVGGHDNGASEAVALSLDDQATQPLAFCPACPLRIATSRMREVYVHDGVTVRRFGWDEPGPQPLGQVQAPMPADAMAVDDASDELVALSAPDHALVVFPRDLAPWRSVPLVPPIPLVGEVTLAVDQRDRSLWIASAGVPALHRFARTPDGGWALAEVVAEPSITAPRSINVLDSGDLVLDGGGVTVHLERNPASGQWAPVPGSLFAGQVTSGVVLIATSRANDDRAQDNFPPSQLLPDPPCRADFNGDGVANSQDFFDFLTTFFAAALAADFNNDQVINSQDFFDFLTAFFAGCP